MPPPTISPKTPAIDWPAIRQTIELHWFSTTAAFLKTMLGGLTLAGSVFIVFVALQEVCHLGFLLYNRGQLEQTSREWLLLIMQHGLTLRMSIAAYVLLPFALIIGFAPLLGHRSKKLWVYIGCFFVGLISLIELSDYEMFRAWGVHFHWSVLFFLAHPVEAAASVASSPWYWGLLAFVGLAGVASLMFWLKARIMLNALVPKPGQGAGAALAATLIVFFALVVARGGFQLTPINQSWAFFSPYARVNQAAVSPTWNLMQSALEFAAQDYTRYHHMPEKQAQQRVAAFSPPTQMDVPVGMVTIKKPNVLIIVWESLTSKVVAPLGGLKGATPYLNAEIDSGFLFTRCLATGDRTEKGLLSIMTGQPAQPTVSATIFPDVTAKFPHLSTSFHRAGYSTHFLYGGALEFANLRSLLSNGEFDGMDGKEVFAKAEQNSKWGAHDHVMLNRLLKKLDSLPKPFFSTALTLSSHEPFEVPGIANKPGTPEDTLFVRSHSYTDQSIGHFLQQARKTSWWDSTLVLIVGDHGHRQPGHTAAHVQAKYAIPMLLTGGALGCKGWRATYAVSQMDAGPLLLALAGVPSHRPFHYARNPLSKSYKPRGIYTFSDGIGLVTPTDTLAMDNLNARILNRRRKHYKGKLKPVALAHLQEITKVMER